MKILKILFLIMIILIFYISYNNTEEFTILDIGSHNFDSYQEARTHNDRSDKYVLAKIIDSNLDFISEEDNNNLKNKDLILTLSFVPNEGNETIINPDTSESLDREDNIFCREYSSGNVKKWYICESYKKCTSKYSRKFTYYYQHFSSQMLLVLYHLNYLIV